MGLRNEANRYICQLCQPPLDTRLLGTKPFYASNLTVTLRGGQGKNEFKKKKPLRLRVEQEFPHGHIARLRKSLVKSRTTLEKGRKRT